LTSMNFIFSDVRFTKCTHNEYIALNIISIISSQTKFVIIDTLIIKY